MLDKDTKQTIDNARDILVGKVPNPVTQIDLITTAMIYKFMDDMDLENISFGGKRVFFVDDLEKYAWSKLLSATVGNSERINLYTEALDKLPYAKQIPQLFRSVFKDAFLPFRDGATLTLFLKEIDSLSYANSENLGDGFEYLLSIMGSQGDAGQFRTPRHIIDFIVEVVNPTKNDSILDPACGTAGFLISAYKHIIKTANEQKKPLSVDAIKQVAQNITGYDIDPTMQKLSLVNLYLHKFTTPKVYEYDTLTSEDRWGDKFDVILANPPFMTPKGGIRPHNKFGIKANKSEVLFVDYFMEHLTLNGRAGFVVPEGIIFQSATAYKSLRKMMVEDNYLYAVVSLPSGVFNPYSGVKTSILFFDRQLAKQMDKILFVEVKNDGFDLGAQRKPIKENDLPSAIDAIRTYQKSYDKADLQLPDNCLLVEKSKIAENGDYNLTASRYKQSTQVINAKWDIVSLATLEQQGKIEFLRGQGISKSDFVINGKYKCIHYGDLYTAYNPVIGQIVHSTNEETKIKSMAGDVLVPATTTADAMGIAVARALNEDNVLIGGDINIVRTKNKYILGNYLSYIINFGVKKELASYAKGVNILHLSNKDIRCLRIPLPPLEVQEEIIKELEGYQAIINGSQNVVDNWKPYFTLKPNWPKVKLGDFADFIRGPFGGSLKKEIFKESGYLVYEQYHAINNDFTFRRYFVDEDKYCEMKRFAVQAGDLIVSCSGTMGKIAIIPNNYKQGIINQALLKLTPHKELNNIFLKLLLQQPVYQSRYFTNQSGVAIQNVVSVKELKEMIIPLPSLSEQKAIVDKIEFEEKYINTCKEYIAYYKQKIADKIQSVWSSK